MEMTQASGSLGKTEDILGEAALSREQRMARWQSRRPFTEHLLRGTTTLEDGSVLPLFDVGDRVVLDTRTRLLKGDPWLETVVGKVRSIDDDTGLVSLFDEESDPRSPMIRWGSFREELQSFFLAPTKGNPFEVPAVPKERPAPIEGKRSRGRPKGSKNRPKDVIQAEWEARRAGRRP